MPKNLTDVKKLKLKKGEFAFERGQTPENFFLLRQGSVELVRNKNTLRTIDSPEVPIGNTDLLLNIDRTFGARATEETELLVTPLNDEAIYKWYLANPSKHIEELRTLSSVLDQFNSENKELFDRYRETRDVFSPFLNPLRTIVEHGPESVDLPPLVKKLLNDYLLIMDQAGKSGKLAIDDLSIADDVKETFDRGEEICSEGEPGEDLYLLLDGSLSVLKEGQLVSSIEKAGLLFGEMAAFLNNKRTASVVAETESTVAVLPIDSLDELFESSSGIAKKINKMLLNRFEKAYELNQQLNRFFSNLAEVFEDENTAERYQSKLKDLVMNLRDQSNIHPEVNEKLGELEDWAESDLEDDLTLFEERLSQADIKRFQENIT